MDDPGAVDQLSECTFTTVVPWVLDKRSRDDLTLLAKVADMAHTWVFAQAQERIKQPENGRSSRSEDVEMTA